MTSTSNSARELMLLQSEMDKNAAVIASLTHETAVTLASAAGAERAAKKHIESLREELKQVHTMTQSVRHRVQGGSTVKSSQVDAARLVLEKKSSELNAVQHEISVLECLLKEFLREDALRIRELFDEKDCGDVLALELISDSRPGRVTR